MAVETRTMARKSKFLSVFLDYYARNPWIDFVLFMPILYLCGYLNEVLKNEYSDIARVLMISTIMVVFYVLTRSLRSLIAKI